MGATVKPFDLFLLFVQQDPSVLKTLEQFFSFRFCFMISNETMIFYEHLKQNLMLWTKKRGKSLIRRTHTNQQEQSKISQTFRTPIYAGFRR